MTRWNPETWKTCNIKQEVVYPDQKEFEKVLSRLAELPPLVAAGEVFRIYLTLKD
jgi:3-deoxy-D-arabino-heptulosonate 7-phosphate (DAHP) synthase class II